MALPFENPNDPAEVKGTTLPVEQPVELRYVRGEGWTTVQAWEATSQDAIVGKAHDLAIALYTNIRVFQKEPGVWRVEGTIEGNAGLPPGEDDENETWEIDSLSESVDIMNHPTFQDIADDELRIVLDGVNNPSPGSAPALTDPVAITLYSLLIRKVDTWSYEVPVLRHTMTPAPDDVSVDGRMEIWTPAQIGVNVPKIATMVNGLTNNNPFGVIAGYTWGWLNTVLRVVEDVNGRSTLTEEWILSNWSTDLYDVY